MTNSINSKNYWDNRFATDWEIKSGREQSRFFAHIAVENLPQWFKHHATTNHISICDWGCAEGDGTDILASYFGAKQVEGVDFSEVAILRAQQYYPKLIFKLEDWLKTDLPNHPLYDIIFSSNTLEHFSNPQSVLHTIANHTTQMIVLMVPFNEFQRIAEHQHTFLAQNIQVVPLSDFVLIHAKIIDTTHFMPTYWNGEQVLLIYANTHWVLKNGFPLSQIYLDTKLSKALGEKEQTAQVLSDQLVEKDLAMQALSDQLTEKEQAMQALSGHLIEKEQAMQVLSDQQAEKDLAMQALSGHLIEKEQAMRALSNQLAEKERAMQALTDQLTEDDQTIQMYSNQLAEKERAMQALSDQLAENDQLVKELSIQLVEKEQVVKIIVAQVTEKEKLLKSIYAARTFRFVTIWWGLRNTINRLSSEMQVFLRQFVKGLLNLVLSTAAKGFYQEFRKEYNFSDRSEVTLYLTDPTILTGYSLRQLIFPDLIKESTVKVSLITTVKNEAANASEWLNSLLRQNRIPDEVVIVDGGSTDGTVNIIREFAKSSTISVRVIEVPGFNIAQGRNMAIQNANYPVIASTDFGCILDRDWLRLLILPFEMDINIEVSAGYYQVIGKRSKYQVTAKLFVAELNSIDPGSFLPSSRSVAFTRTAWSKAGGYPEWLTDAAEDTLFDFELKRCGGHWAFVPEAKVYWSVSKSFPRALRTIYRYAKGDGEVGLFANNYWHKAKAVLGVGFLIVCIIFVALSVFVFPLMRIPALVITGVILAGFWRNMPWSHFDTKTQWLRMNVIISALVVIAQVLGFTLGVGNRKKVRIRQREQFVDRLKQVVAQHPDSKGIVVYPPTHDWGFMFQRPHQMARAFARKGYLYFFCTNNEKTDTIIGFQEVEPLLYVCNVPLETFSALIRPIVYVGAPWHKNVLHIFDHPQIIYDHYDDLKVSSASLVDHIELLNTAKVIVVTSQRLLNAVRVQRPDALMIPNGVDYERIHQSHSSENKNIYLDWESIVQKGHPIVGYSGALAEWFDYELLSSVAKARSDLEFVLIGVNYDGSLDHSNILELQNVHWLGMKNYDELIIYIWRFDVGIIPFKINDITLSTSPIKLFEYMACGKPVVTTALPECKKYEGVFMGETCEQIIDCLNKALSVRWDHKYLSVIDKVARENTWNRRSDEIIAALNLQSQNQSQEATLSTKEEEPLSSDTWNKTLNSFSAKALNEALYSDVRSIPPNEISQFTQEVLNLCRQRNYSQEYTKSWISHRFRLLFTLKWLESIIFSPLNNTRGLELGGESIVTDLLSRHLPQVKWLNVETDLRLSWPISDQSIDLIVCTEVLEHLSDLPQGLQDSFNKTGLRATLKECYRVLKPGGYLFVTTPSAASVVQMISILNGSAPWFYSLHVREYTVDELLAELKHFSFEIELWRTVHCLTVDQATDYSPIFEMLLDYSLPTSHRGDNIFLISRKPTTY